MTQDSLKNCAHCGSADAPRACDGPENGYMIAESSAIVCSVHHGGCGACGGWRQSDEEAAEAWNTRAAVQGGELVEELQGFADHCMQTGQEQVADLVGRAIAALSPPADSEEGDFNELLEQSRPMTKQDMDEISSLTEGIDVDLDGWSCKNCLAINDSTFHRCRNCNRPYTPPPPPVRPYS